MRPMRRLQPVCSRKSKTEFMPMNRGMEEVEVVMPLAEEEVVGVGMVLHMTLNNKIHLGCIAMIISNAIFVTSMTSPMKKSLGS